MVMDAPTLYPEIVETSTPPGRGQHGYFRRLRDGWIVTHGAWPSAQSDMSFKGFVFLQQFGVWVMPGPGKGSTVTDRRGIAFNPGDEPWRLIFQHPEGSATFPVEQVIAYRWHIRPPYREVRFPQVEGTVIYDLFCPECEKGIFSAEHEQDAANMLRQHLVSRFDESHSYRPEDLRALGQELSIDFFAERRIRRRPVRGEDRALEAPAAAPEMVATETLLRCRVCQQEFASPAALGGHMKAHKMVRQVHHAEEASAAPA